jgi:hypothetical protein
MDYGDDELRKTAFDGVQFDVLTGQVEFGFPADLHGSKKLASARYNRFHVAQGKPFQSARAGRRESSRHHRRQKTSKTVKTLIINVPPEPRSRTSN